MKKLLILLSLLPTIIFGQFQDLDSLDRFISRQVLDYEIPGLAIGILEGDKVVFKKGYGTTGSVNGYPVSTNTIFPISSCTKAFTAASIGILVDEGRLDWKDKVIKHLPDFKLSDPWITKEITISDILSHRSGLGAYDGDLLWYGTKYSRQEIIEKIQYYPIKNDFRIDFAYQNIMYLAAGLIIEKVTGKTWDEFVKNQIFTSLSMNTSSTSITELLVDSSYARPHIKNKPVSLLNLDNIAPTGAVNSSVDDMMNWLRIWLNEGSLEGTQILSNETFHTITSPKTMMSDHSSTSYGFGWELDNGTYGKTIGHGGALPGYKSSIVILPEKDIAIIVLTNKITYFNDELAGIVIDYLLNPRSTNWREVEKSLYSKNFRFSWDEENQVGSNGKVIIPHGFEKYKGEYEDKIYGKAIISQKEGKPFLSLLPSEDLLSGYLYYLDENTFTIVFKDEFISPGKIIFELNDDKEIIGFKIDLPSDDFHFEYLDFKKRNRRR